MDIHALLNKATESDTAAAGPRRASSLVQPPQPPGLLTRQTSMPNPNHYQYNNGHYGSATSSSSYSTQQQDLRGRSLSVSPKTMPTPIPRQSVTDVAQNQQRSPPIATPPSAQSLGQRPSSQQYRSPEILQKEATGSHSRGHSHASAASLTHSDPQTPPLPVSGYKPVVESPHHFSYPHPPQNLVSHKQYQNYQQIPLSHENQVVYAAHSPTQTKRTSQPIPQPQHQTRPTSQSKPIVNTQPPYTHPHLQTSMKLTTSPSQIQSMPPPSNSSTPQTTTTQINPHPNSLTPQVISHPHPSTPASQQRQTTEISSHSSQPRLSPSTQLQQPSISTTMESPTISRNRSINTQEDHHLSMGRVQSPATPPQVSSRSKMSESPKLSRKRSISAVDEGIQVDQPTKRQRFAQPPQWAIRANNGLKERIPRNPAERSVSSFQRLSQPQPQPQSQTAQKNTTEVNGKEGSLQPQPSAMQDQDKWECSLDNVEPFNEITRQLADFLDSNVVQAPAYLLDFGNFEIEAKLGKLINIETDERIDLPVTAETFLKPNSIRTRFQSKMTQEQHKTINDFLNTETRRASHTEGRIPIQYEHRYEIDTLYEAPDDFLASLPPNITALASRFHHRRPRVRVTRDTRTGKVKEMISKFTVAHLEAFCPQDVLDYRVTVNFECAYRGPLDALRELGGPDANAHAREKDRLSYSHQCFSVDLTQVLVGDEKSHELEIELDADVLRDQGLKMIAGESHRYEQLVGSFLNYVRVVNRASNRRR